MNTNENFAGASTGRYIVLDCEFRKDWDLYNRYLRLDPDDPATCRWPMKRVVSASVMVLTMVDRHLEASDLTSFAGADEGRLLVELFAYLNERSRHQLVTYGGISADTPILRLAAMKANLKLPPQLRFSDRNRSLHLDLAIAMRAGGAYVHLSELATRLGIPCKLAGPASQVPQLFAAKDYRALGHISECDVVTTAFLLASYLEIQGELQKAKAGQLNIIRHVRPLRAHAPYARMLGNVADRLRQEIDDEMKVWMARVA